MRTLREVAHSRTGDKGDTSTVSVIAYDPADYPILERYVTAGRVRAHLGDMVRGEVVRYALPRLGALNFVLRGALSGGVTRSLALDGHGKSLSSAVLSLELPDAGEAMTTPIEAAARPADARPHVDAVSEVLAIEDRHA